jgi:hypothetical protein
MATDKNENEKPTENEFSHCDFISREHAIGDDPWAMGGYTPPQLKLPLPLSNLRHPEELAEQADVASPRPASPVRPPASPAPPSPKTDFQAALEARKSAVQAELNVQSLRKRALADRTREAVQYGILGGVVWSIREALRAEGISVTCLEDVCDFQHRPIMSHIDFHLEAIGQTNFKAVIARRFVDEFLRHNPKHSHMFTARTKLPPDGAVQAAQHFEHDGLLVRAIGEYRIETDSHMVRVDCAWAVAAEENLILCPTTQIDRAYLGPSTGAGLIRKG